VNAYNRERQILVQGPPGNVVALLDAFRDEYVRSAARTTPDAVYVPTSMFDEFVLENFPWQTDPLAIEKLRIAARKAAAENSCDAPQPTPLSQMLDRGPANQLPGARIEFDGPARTYDRSNAFPYTTGTLFNEQSGLYDKLLWWYFGGRAFRITKAMLIPYDDSPIHVQGEQDPRVLYEGAPKPHEPAHRGSLLIGYQGPGSFP
jgi:hypothetical protein